MRKLTEVWISKMLVEDWEKGDRQDMYAILTRKPHLPDKWHKIEIVFVEETCSSSTEKKEDGK